MADGILIVDKPAGWTSQDVVSRLRGVYHEKRIGHGGTLDPMATGVLPVFVGRATRAVEFFEHAEKEYEATLRLGTVTDTQDITGTVVQTNAVTVTREALMAALEQFRGEQKQIPPMYSAVKVGGKKLYEIARKGGEVERRSRSITVFELELLDGGQTDWRIRVRCSKGTYIRTLCHDIGYALGCGGCMAALRRTAAGAYRQQDSIPLESILRSDAPETLLLPTDSLFSHLPRLVLSENQEKCVRNGAAFSCANAPDGPLCAYSKNGEFLALCALREGRLATVKSFFRPETN